MCINPFLVVRCDGTSWWAPSVSARIFPGGAWGWFPVPVRWGSGETARPGSAVHVGTDTPWVSRPLEPAEDPAAARAEYIAFQPAGRLLSTEQVSGLRLRPPARS
jgi:hypothetical protein